MLGQEIKLNQSTLRLIIECEKKYKKWANYISNSCARILVSYEKALNLDFNSAAKAYYSAVPQEEKNSIKIVGKDTVFLKGNWIGAYNNTSGIFGEPRGIFVEFGLTPVLNPSVVFHELGHFWFYHLPWLCEGIVSYLPIVLHRTGYLKLTKPEIANINNHWGFNHIFKEGDKPVINDFRKDAQSVRLWYCKTFKIQYIINKQLGDKLYLVFLKDILNISREASTESIIKILNKLKYDNWENIFSGWVLPGAYSLYQWNDFIKLKL